MLKSFIKKHSDNMGNRHTTIKNLFLRGTLFFLSMLNSKYALAQQNVEDKLIRNCREAKGDSDYIIKTGQLSEYYYANKNFEKGDSLIEKQIMLAEATLNSNLILTAYFGNAGYRSPGAATKDRSKNSVVYIMRALYYAKANKLNDYLALAHANLAALNLSEGKLDEAFKNASFAFTTALNTNNDSAKVICTIELGNVYLLRTDILMAFRTYTNAINIATENKNESLLPRVYHAMANLYKKLGQEESAKPYLFKSLAINKKLKDNYGQINDYIFLAKLSNYSAGKEYLQQAVQLADTLQNIRLKIEAEKILFFHMMMKETPSALLSYLDINPELKNVFNNSGPDYLNWVYAEIYFYGSKPDSALVYFRKAESSFNAGYDITTQKNYFGEFADCLQTMGKIPEAITYYQKATELAKKSSDLRILKTYAGYLKNLYQQQGDYKQAFNYSVIYEQYKDSVDLLGRDRELVLLELENVTKQQQRETELALEKQRRKYNLQYMMITIIVATAFLLIIMIGMFKVSAAAIRLMGFLSLIFFFEFIILILDNWIHHLTHGEPWKVWLIKIGIISFLLPMHHFLEHKLIQYLLSRHLITMRSRFSLSKLFGKKKKSLPEQNNPEETLNEENFI